jgi:hypothetical protein
MTSQNMRVSTPCGRNSGEMTTSLTNTLLSQYLFEFAMQELKVDKEEYKFKVEGDDNIASIP